MRRGSAVIGSGGLLAVALIHSGAQRAPLQQIGAPLSTSLRTGSGSGLRFFLCGFPLRLALE